MSKANEVDVRLRADASEMKLGLAAAKAENAQAAEAIQAAWKTTTQEVSQSTQRMQSSVQNSVNNMRQQVSQSMQQVQSSVQQSVGAINMSFGNIFSNAAGFALGMAGFQGITAAIQGSIGAGIRFDSTMQQAKISFDTMLGSVEKADKLLADLQKFAADTPFEFPDLQNAAKKMLAFGFSAEQIMPMLKSVGDAAAGLGLTGSVGLGRIITALGQMRAKGKISAEEMLQLTEAGIPAWEILAQAMGKTTGEAMKLSEKGLIPANTAVQALVDGMEARFPNMMDKQSRSFAGLMSTLKDNFNETMGMVVKPGFEAMTTTFLPNLIAKVNEFKTALSAGGLGSAMKTIFPTSLVDGVAAAVRGVGAAIQFVGQHADAVTASVVALTTAFATLRVLTLASTIAATAHTVALAAQTGTVALATAGTSAFTLANIAATASALVTTAATQGLTAAFAALAAAMNLNPIVLAVTVAMAVLAGAVYAVYTNWDAFKSWCVALWNGIVDIVADNIGLITAAFPPLGAAIYVIYTYWDDAVKLIKSLWQSLVDGLNAIWEQMVKVVNGIAAVWDKATSSLREGLGKMMSAMAGIVEEFIPDWAKSFFDQIVSLGNRLAGKTAEIGNTIRKNLTITLSPMNAGIADLRKFDDTNTIQPIATETPEPYDWTPPGGAADSGGSTSMMQQWEQELQQLKDKQDAFHELSKQAEINFWQTKLALTESGSQEQIQINHRIAELEKQIAKDRLNNRLKDLRTELQDAATAGQDRLAISKKIGDEIAATYGTESREYQKWQRENVQLARQVANEKLQIEKDLIQHKQTLRQTELQIEEENINHKKQLGQISEIEAIQRLNELENKKYQIKLAALQEQLALEKAYIEAQGLAETEGYRKIFEQIEQLQAQHRLKVQQQSNQLIQAIQKPIIEMQKGIQRSLEQSIAGVLKGQMSIRSAFRSFAQSIIGIMADMWAKDIAATIMGTNTKTAAVAAGAVAQTDATTAAATTATATAAATTAANMTMLESIGTALSSIPWYGWVGLAILAGVAAARGGGSTQTTTGEGVNLGRNPESYYRTPADIGMPSFAIGAWRLPQDMIAKVHKDEMIVPAQGGAADSVRAMLSGSPDAAGSGSPVVFSPQISIAAHAIDQRGMKQALKSSAKDMVKILNVEWNNFNRPKGR